MRRSRRRWSADSRPTGLRRLVAVIPAAAIAIVVASCGGGQRVTPAPADLPTPVVASPGAPSSGAPSAGMSLPAGTPTAAPPAAVLAGLDGEDAPGDLGSFTWDGFASESPWIVGPVSGTARPGASLGVVLASGPALSRWRALWARVTGTGTGTPIDGGGGTSSDGISGGAGRTLVVRAPADPGQWSLALTADLGPGRNATWYWRIEVRP